MESWINIFRSVNCFDVCDVGRLLLKGQFFMKECHSNGDFGQILKMAYQRLRPCLFDDHVVLLLQGLENGDVMTGRTGGGTRQEPDTNVVFGKKNSKITQLFENARSCHTGSRGSLQSMLTELGNEAPHLQAIYDLRHPSCSMQNFGLSKGDALVAMWYPSKKDNDQLKELSVVVTRLI